MPAKPEDARVGATVDALGTGELLAGAPVCVTFITGRSPG